LRFAFSFVARAIARRPHFALNWGCDLIIASLPVLAMSLYNPLETSYLPKRYKDYPKADAIVVLGGTASSLTPPRVEVEETHGSRLTPLTLSIV
jgi:uncharacterized SAM-binding protein YcdF (DUF218 family)